MARPATLWQGSRAQDAGMRPAVPPPLPAAAVCAIALWQLAQATPLAALPAPGLALLAARLGAGDALAHLLPVLAAGSIVAALVQPLAHVRHARPWAHAVATALALAVLLLPVPLPVLLAALPFAVLAGVGRWFALAAVAAVVAPAAGIVALGVVIGRLATALRLPDAANDNQARAVRAG